MISCADKSILPLSSYCNFKCNFNLSCIVLIVVVVEVVVVDVLDDDVDDKDIGLYKIVFVSGDHMAKCRETHSLMPFKISYIYK